MTIMDQTGKYKSNYQDVWVVVTVGLLFIIVTIGYGWSQSQNTSSAKDNSLSNESTAVMMTPSTTQLPTVTDSIDDGTASILNQKVVQTVQTATSGAHLLGSPTVIQAPLSNSSISGQMSGISPTPVNQLIHGLGSLVVGGQVVEYTVDFPSYGGAISGSGSGACTGSIMGTFVAETDNAGGSMEGTCSIDGKEVNASGTFLGKVYLSRGKGNGTWEGKDVNGKNGSGQWELSFVLK